MPRRKPVPAKAKKGQPKKGQPKKRARRMSEPKQRLDETEEDEKTGPAGPVDEDDFLTERTKPGVEELRASLHNRIAQISDPNLRSIFFDMLYQDSADNPNAPEYGQPETQPADKRGESGSNTWQPGYAKN